MILEYDGTPGGFFTLLYYLFTEELGECSLRRREEMRQRELFDGGDREVRRIVSDGVLARKVTTGMGRKLGKPLLNTLTQALLSEKAGIEEEICRVIRLARRRRSRVLDRLADPAVHEVTAASRRVMREYHRYLGLIRFRQLADGIYYAPFRPDTNLLPLLSRHFVERFPDRPWIIHDVKRGTALIYNGSDLEAAQILEGPDGKDGSLFSEEEELFQQLWKGYYKSIGVENRRNEKLRRQFLPRKTWEFLPEMEPD